MNTLVLSDLHLGSKASHAAANLPDLARITATFDRVILNGDTLDRCYTAPVDHDGASQLLAAVQKNCASRNAPPEFLTGNHDPVISKTHWIYDELSQTLIYHGDCIRDCTHPTKKTDQLLMAKLSERWAKLGGRPKDFIALHENYREVQCRELPIINPYKKSKNVIEYFMSLVYPPRRPFDIMHYWMTAPERALATARGFNRPIKHVVVGHTHKPGQWRIDGINIYNTGSYMPFSGAFGFITESESVRFAPLKQLFDSSRKIFSLGGSSSTSALTNRGN